MARIRGQPVGNVDARARSLAHLLRRLDTRLRQTVAVRQRRQSVLVQSGKLATQRTQAKRRIADGASHEHAVAGSRTIAPNHWPPAGTAPTAVMLAVSGPGVATVSPPMSVIANAR